MAYKHGIYGSEVATSLVPMTEVSAGLPVVFGTAPVHLATDPAAANTPVLCYKYSEAVAAFGYSNDWEKYTLCEFMDSQFSLFNMAPVVFINVLDPNKHFISDTDKDLTMTENVGKIAEPVILKTLEVKLSADGTPLVEGTDYTAAYNDDDEVEITAIEGGALENAATAVVSYHKVDASAVTAQDIVGGVDTATGKSKGLELLNEVYPRFGLVPGIIVAPGWSHNSNVAAVMKSKADTINGNFKAVALVDVPTDEVKKYSEVKAWKDGKNIVDPQLAVCWPMLSLAGVKYHMSTQMAGVMCATDAAHNDVPYWSPSNQSLQCDAAVVGEDEVYLDTETAAYLNGQGIVTAINQGGWKLWGNRTSCYPSNTDVKDSFLAIRRMFCWVNNTLITTFWNKIDNPINKRLIATVVDSANIWFNGLTAKGYLLGGRVEFREDENTTTDLMDGKINFHVYMTPPSPARDIEFVQEYDPDYIATLFE